MKKTVILFLMCVLVLSSCASNTGLTSDGMKIAKHGARDYYFYFDADWDFERNDGMVSIKPPPNNMGVNNCSLSVTAFSLSKEKSNYNVEKQWEEYSADLQKTFKDFKIIEDVENDITKLDNTPAIRKDYTMKVADTTYRFAQLICIRNANIYLITFTSLPDEYKENIKILDVVAKNFYFD